MLHRYNWLEDPVPPAISDWRRSFDPQSRCPDPSDLRVGGGDAKYFGQCYSASVRGSPTHTHAHTHTHIYTYIFIHIYLYIYVYIYIRKPIRMCMCIYIYTYLYICLCACGGV